MLYSPKHETGNRSVGIFPLFLTKQADRFKDYILGCIDSELEKYRSSNKISNMRELANNLALLQTYLSLRNINPQNVKYFIVTLETIIYHNDELIKSLFLANDGEGKYTETQIYKKLLVTKDSLVSSNNLPVSTKNYLIAMVNHISHAVNFLKNSHHEWNMGSGKQFVNESNHSERVIGSVPPANPSIES